ncbi:helix-turn-helix transcriptional regulator [Janthinobacterium sp.]|uniref:helix-turn-helix transcriptional regulator n=1 Tax=Janthinobacterium sp. TaxID=1871054 RepID=UPI00261EADEA|nr:helix-turn-helix transcriptional regulator [Janthinobacterium sp.]
MHVALGFLAILQKKVGMPAMAYLVRWRMLLASDRLLQSQDAISTIALELGYRSESAFSFAFKREMGCSPRQYCRVPAG